ncbi:MAG: 2-dehydro-3-deoxygalactonokinase [Roseitalea porphyridii]|uniref:2-dehydro-3-deoxygalactonokinase n=1 Tax=Roseitalea porphyridii TaxID=1852022 RepID=UPI0032EFA4F3
MGPGSRPPGRGLRHLHERRTVCGAAGPLDPGQFHAPRSVERRGPAALRRGSAAFGGELLHTPFSARTLPLFGHISEDMVADYLSGLLIGAEIGAALAGRPAGRAITVIGRGDLCDRYLSALGVFGVDARRAAGHAAAYGQARIAQACNLTTPEAPGLGVA